MVTRAEFSRNIPDLFDTIVGNALGIGNVWFVDSGHDDATDTSGAGRNVGKPFATLAYALGQVTAANGDTLFISPGHTETITAADGVRFAANSEGLNVIGLGAGFNRPTFNFSTLQAADFEIDAANVTIRNVSFDMTGIDGLTSGIDVNSDHFSLIDCEILMADVAGQAVMGIDLGGDADYAKILGLTVEAHLGTGGAEAIRVSGLASNIEIAYCRIVGDFTNACIFSSANFVDGYVHHNYLRNNSTGNHALEFTGTPNGLLAYNMYHSDMTAPTGVDPGSMFSIECYHADILDTSGILAPVAT